MGGVQMGMAVRKKIPGKGPNLERYLSPIKASPQVEVICYSLVRLPWFEHGACGLEVRCSIQLSYRRIGSFSNG